MNTAAPTSPFRHEPEPDEPPRGTVLAYSRPGADAVLLPYVSVRAGDGLWYTTGRLPQQGVGWDVLWPILRGLGTPVHYATAWAELDPEGRERRQAERRDQQVTYRTLIGEDR